jgi:hypothetical protein
VLGNPTTYDCKACNATTTGRPTTGRHCNLRLRAWDGDRSDVNSMAYLQPFRIVSSPRAFVERQLHFWDTSPIVVPFKTAILARKR